MTAAPTASSERVRFPGLNPAAFEHPMDRTALEALRRAPGIDHLFKKLSALGFERQVRLHFTADSLRLSPRQFPRIYARLEEAAEILDMARPDLYLSQNPIPSSIAVGMDRNTIILSSGLVDLMDDAELQWVIGRELGHIKSGHMLYHTIAVFLGLVGRVAARNLPFIQIVSEAMLYAFYDWLRKSELTADRAGLLVAQDADVPVHALLKFAGGAPRAEGQLNLEEFLKQAEDYEDMDASLLNIWYKFEMTRFQAHPFPALRAREISRWAASEEYRRILSGDYTGADAGAADRHCPRCAAVVHNPLFRFCPECGANL